MDDVHKGICIIDVYSIPQRIQIVAPNWLIYENGILNEIYIFELEG